MRLAWSVLCRDVELVDGRLTARDLGWDTLLVQGFPAATNGAVLLHFTYDGGPDLAPQPVQLHFVNAGGDEIVPAAEMIVSPPREPAADLEIGSNAVMRFEGLPIPAAGIYTIQVTLHGELAAELRFRATLAGGST